MTTERQALIAAWRAKAAEHRANETKFTNGSRYHDRVKAGLHFSAAALETCANDLEALSSLAHEPRCEKCRGTGRIELDGGWIECPCQASSAHVETCEWRPGDDGLWRSACGEEHGFGEPGGPVDFGMRFCYRCGRALVVRPVINAQGDAVCQHGTAMDVHCCNCHSGFLFAPDACVCAEEATAEKVPPDPMGDDTRAAIVRQLTDWWNASPHPEIKKLSPETIRQMAMAAGAFARGIMGEIAELKQLAGDDIKAGDK